MRPPADGTAVEVAFIRVGPLTVERPAPWWALLDGDERDRADRFVHGADRFRFVGAHACWRLALADLLRGPHGGPDPADLRIERHPCPLCAGPHGRPRIEGVARELSLSRTRGLAALALGAAHGPPVGLDVESRRARSAANALDGVLHPDERAELATAPAADRAGRSLRCFVRKEAYLKGIGTGLATDPASVAVGLGVTHEPTEPVAGAGPAGWTLADLPAGPDHLGALAVGPPRGTGPLTVTIRWWSLDPAGNTLAPLPAPAGPGT
jgi:4'-phosphopantetheinyl transferase